MAETKLPVCNLLDAMEEWSESENGEVEQDIEVKIDPEVTDVDIPSDQEQCLKWIPEHNSANMGKEVSTPHQVCYVEEVTIGSTVGTTIPVTIMHSKCNALVNTGATSSCITETYYENLMLPKLHKFPCVSVRSASERNLPVKLTTCSFILGQNIFLCIYSREIYKNLLLGTRFSLNT